MSDPLFEERLTDGADLIQFADDDRAALRQASTVLEHAGAFFLAGRIDGLAGRISLTASQARRHAEVDEAR